MLWTWKDLNLRPPLYQSGALTWLSYTSSLLAPPAGIEPATPDRQSGVIPLHHDGSDWANSKTGDDPDQVYDSPNSVGREGIEPSACGLRVRRSA